MDKINIYTEIINCLILCLALSNINSSLSHRSKDTWNILSMWCDYINPQISQYLLIHASHVLVGHTEALSIGLQLVGYKLIMKPVSWGLSLQESIKNELSLSKKAWLLDFITLFPMKSIVYISSAAATIFMVFHMKWWTEIQFRLSSKTDQQHIICF